MFDYFILSSSILASVSTYHQIYRVIKNRSSKDISFFHVMCVFYNMITHLIYAIHLQQNMLQITFGNGVAATGCLLIIGGYFWKQQQLVQHHQMFEFS